MNKILGGYICVTGILLALGLDISTLVVAVTAILILVGIVHYLALRRLWEGYWLMLFGLFFGPILLASLLRAACRGIWAYLVFNLGVFAPVPLIFGMLLVSFLAFMYLRARISPLLGDSDKEKFINERKPVLPPHLEEEDDLIWTEQEKELDLPKEYSDED
jgi:hypothetical protein